MVVQDIFMTETAKLADVVLPAVSFAEKNGTFTNTERRVQRITQVIEPLEQSHPDWKIISDLATEMGYEMAYESAEDIFSEIRTVTPSYAGMSYERIAEEGGLQWPCPAQDHPGTPYLHKGKFVRGKGLFHAVEFIPPAELPDEEFPLLLSTGRVLYHYLAGTTTRRDEGLNFRYPNAYVEMNPADTFELGIEEEEVVRVSSRRGDINVAVKITKRSPKGVVFIPFHFIEAPANRLTNPAFDPIAKIPEYKVCAVRVEKIN
jgi:predicted molibdopterin-dependent oxidoreductase YjgC